MSISCLTALTNVQIERRCSRSCLRLETDKLNFFVTSRSEKDIEKAFEGKESLEVDQKCVQIDIATHIGWMLDNNKKLNCIKPDLKETIKKRLAEKSAGM